MSTPEKFGGFFHFFGKGDFKGLVLHLLEEHPMHGYEIIKAIEERYHGFYKPSAGAIYPARAALFREFRATGKLLRTNMSEVTPKQANELRQVVIEMREKAMRILSK